MLKIVITGGGGFVARYLVESVRETWPDSEIVLWCLEPMPRPEAVNRIRALDLRDAIAVSAAIAEDAPTHLVHLAAQSHVPTSFNQPELTWQVNVMATLYLLEAVRLQVPQCFVLYVSSSEVYGQSFQHNLPVDETALLQPSSPYAASKAAADLMVRQYARQGLNTLCARPFNHLGAGQSPDFVAPAFARQIAAVEKGRRPLIRVGNLEALRDFLDVRDVVAAYVLMLQQAGRLPPGEAINVGSGISRSIRSLLDDLMALSSCSTIAVEPDPERMRPSDTPCAVGDCRKAQRLLGWQPQVPWNQTLLAVLQEARELS